MRARSAAVWVAAALVILTLPVVALIVNIFSSLLAFFALEFLAVAVVTAVFRFKRRAAANRERSD